MAAANQVLGRVTVLQDGQALLSNADAKLTLAGVTRETIKGDVVHGFAESIQEAMVECTVSVASVTDLDALAAVTDASITFQTDIGITYVLPHAWQENAIAAAAKSGGQVPLKFAAKTHQRVS